MCLFSMKLIVILALTNYAIILRNICLIMIVIFVMANNLAGTYACVWGIIGDYVYTYVTSYPKRVYLTFSHSSTIAEGIG